MEILTIPAFFDNYLFMLCDRNHGTALVIDPGDEEPILKALEQEQLTLTKILITHHHHDHVGGIGALKQKFPGVQVYGGHQDRGHIPHQTHFLRENDQFKFSDREGHVLELPGHTTGHIGYYFPPASAPNSQTQEQLGDLFCGDVLFSGGCGRLLGGTAMEMVHSLEKIQQLPLSTRVWCAHEYTLDNLKFALTFDDQNDDLKAYYHQVKYQRSQNKFTIPTTLAQEIKINPFLRCHHPTIQKAMGNQDKVQVFATMRNRKNNY